MVEANIVFINVQSVGVDLGFCVEELGLALAIKEKYPKKKVAIYSAETKGDLFHTERRKADSFLSKNGDLYEFQKIVEDFIIGTNERYKYPMPARFSKLSGRVLRTNPKSIWEVAETCQT